jgi:hypothetical protein
VAVDHRSSPWGGTDKRRACQWIHVLAEWQCVAAAAALVSGNVVRVINDSK